MAITDLHDMMINMLLEELRRPSSLIKSSDFFFFLNFRYCRLPTFVVSYAQRRNDRLEIGQCFRSPIFRNEAKGNENIKLNIV